MLNELVYCPRLFYIEWVDKDFRDNVLTVEGRHKHRRVDRASGDVPDTAAPPEGCSVARSVEMSAPAIGLVTRMDQLEVVGRTARPVDYKRGRRPDVPLGAWEPERVQVCA